MNQANILVIGAGIGGLTAAIALRQRGFTVDVIERDASMAVYGVGIIQQANVIRAVANLGVLDDYLQAGFGFEFVTVFAEDGTRLARIPAPKLMADYPANVGISRRSLHNVLVAKVRALGASIHAGVIATALEDDGSRVRVTFSSIATKDYDLVIGADGVHSTTRATLFPEAKKPQYTGQGVWRYNFERSADVDGVHTYHGQVSTGLVPLSNALMYMFVTTAEPDNPHYPKHQLAAAMRQKLSHSAPVIRTLAQSITDDDAVVYRPLEWLFLEGPWHRGRVVLLGDAVHTTTPHLGQGAGLAIEDSLVLADELTLAANPEQAFGRYRERRHERCRYIVERSLALCEGQLGQGPLVDPAQATRDMFAVISKPI